MRLITVTFPVIRYHELIDRGDAAINHGLCEDPKRLGVVWRWPDRRMFCPGGIMDSSGLDIPIIDAVGAYDNPTWWTPLAELGLRRFKIELVYGQPRQLTLDEFKSKLVKLVMPMRGIGRDLKALKAGTNYRDVLLGRWGIPSSSMLAPPIRIQIAIP